MRITEKAINLNELTTKTEPAKERDQPIGNTLGQLLDRAVAQGKMRTVAGPSESGENGPVPANCHYPNENQAALARTAHVRRPNEGFMQLVSRTGIGLHFVLNSSKDQISEFCRVSEESAREHGTWKPHSVNVNFEAPRTVTTGSRVVMVG